MAKEGKDFKKGRPKGIPNPDGLEYIRRQIKNLGFLDGPFGIIESIYQAFSKTITYLFLYEKQNKKGRSL